METETATGTVQTLDCQGLLCPLPIIKLSKAIKAVAVGDSVAMLATDPGSVPDMEAFEKQTGHKIVQRSQDGAVYRFVVKRTK
jgi:tRNA 2-thiouridine synthesizing protein A